jgi:hypothetical protein
MENLMGASSKVQERLNWRQKVSFYKLIKIIYMEGYRRWTGFQN